MGRRLSWLLLGVTLAVACVGETTHDEASRAPSLEVVDATTWSTNVATARAAGYTMLLGVDDIRVLAARPLTTDAHDLSFVPMRLALTTASGVRELGAGSWIDAALVPSTGDVLMVDQTRTLFVWSRGALTKLDDAVVPGLATSPDGRRAAYAKGDMPELDIVEVDLDTRMTRVVAANDGPEHAPCYANDTGRLAWIAYPQGRPAMLATNGRNAPSVVVPRLDVVPDGHHAPIWSGHVFVLSGPESVQAVAEQTGEVLLDLAGAGATDHPRVGAVIERADGRWLTPRGAAR